MDTLGVFMPVHVSYFNLERISSKTSDQMDATLQLISLSRPIEIRKH